MNFLSLAPSMSRLPALVRACRLTTVVSLCLGLGPLVQAQNWPMFRGPDASGVASGARPPVTWVESGDDGILWKTEIPGLGHSSPIVWGDRIFLTTAVGSQDAAFNPEASSGRTVFGGEEEQEWRLFCIDRGTGRVLWNRLIRRGVPRLHRHQKGSHANETPATDGRHVVTFLGSEGLFVYDFEGKSLWRRDLGLIDAGYVGRPEFEWGTASSPLIFEGLVIVQADSRGTSFIAAFDLASGEESWRTQRPSENPAWSTPILVHTLQGTQLVTNSSHYLRGYNPRTGQELWRFLDEADVKVPTPVSGPDLIFFSGGAPRGRRFFALRKGGRGDISTDRSGPNSFLAWSVDHGGPYTPSPILLDDLLYVLTDNGVLGCYEAGSGENVYRTRVPEVGAAYSASPVAASGFLYFASQDGAVHVVRAGRSFELVASNDLGESLMATPAISGSYLYLRGQHHLFAVGPTQTARRSPDGGSR